MSKEIESKEVEEILLRLADQPTMIGTGGLLELPKDREKEFKRLQRFHQILFENDPLSIVIRGHLYVESALIKLVRDALPQPEAIDFSKLNFPTKVELAVALGLISEREEPAYRALNRLRNDLAHQNLADDLEFHVGVKDEDKLVSTLWDDEARKYASTKGEFPTRLRRVVLYLFFNLDHRRRMRAG